MASPAGNQHCASCVGTLLFPRQTVASMTKNFTSAGSSVYARSRVARSPVFYGRSRISDSFSRLPGEAAGENKSPVFC